MGNAVNIFDIAGEDLATFLAKSVSDGTWADVIVTEKTDDPDSAAAASQIDTNVGALWGNALDDYIRASYPILRGALVHEADTANPHATTLALALAEGNSTGATDIEVTTGQSIVGQAGGAVTFDGSGNVAMTGALFLAGAEAGDAQATADDLIIGDGAASYGMTIFTGAASSGAVRFTDTAGASQGAVVYVHSTNILQLVASGGARAYVASSGLHPVTDDLYDLGLSTERWRNGYLSGSLVVGDVGTEDNAIDLAGIGTLTAGLRIGDFDDQKTVDLIIDRHSTTMAPAIVTGRSRGTDATHVAVQDGDTLLSLFVAGHDGTNYAAGGTLEWKVDGTPGTNDMPTRFALALSADGSASPTERLVIEPDGTTTISGNTEVDGVLTVTGRNVSRVVGSTARGTTNTTIYRWTSEVEQAGTSITYTDSATDGGYWTINDAGIYAVTASQDTGGDGALAISVGTLSNTLLADHIRALAYDGATGATPLSVSWTGPISAGQVVWIAGFAQDPQNTLASTFNKTVTVVRIC